MSRNLSRLNLSARGRLVALMALLGVLALAVAGSVYFVAQALSLRADLKAPVSAQHVRVTDPIMVKFSRDVDASRVHVGIVPATPIQVQRLSDRLVIKPAAGRWTAAKKYAVMLSDVPDSTHTSTLKGFRAIFETQPRVGVKDVKVGGQALKDGQTFAPSSKLALEFTQAMKPASVVLTLNGTAITPAMTWSKDATSAELSLPGLPPYAPLTLGVMPTAVSAKGDPITDLTFLTARTEALLPSNSSSGIGPGWKTLAPIQIVVENSDPARPQSGLQQADIVYEYISEYSITRMTAIYFNQPPGQVGPVRSCRMINQYLAYGFGGYTMCSGASVGTLHQIFSHDYSGFSINDFDTGNHFRRVGFKDAPHNLYTDAADAVRLRQERGPNLSSPYLIDPPHPDIDMGVPSGAPSVPLHAVSYAYDGGSASYLRFDHGTPFIDANTGHQLSVKNVVIVHTNFHMGGWIEDENGGAGSVWYDMSGAGQAEIFSDGKLVNGTWHMGPQGANYWDLNQPMWFTDEKGNVIELNTGLTWIHVVGNGQTS